MIIVAFISLGFLIGNMTGMTASSVVGELISLLFVFAGGTAIALTKKLNDDEMRRVSIAITSISISCLLGVYSGIYVNENRLLSPNISRGIITLPQAAAATRQGGNKYLRNNFIKECNYIDQQFQQGRMKQHEAYSKLQELCDRE